MEKRMLDFNQNSLNQSNFESHYSETQPNLYCLQQILSEPNVLSAYEGS